MRVEKYIFLVRGGVRENVYFASCVCVPFSEM